MKGKCEDSSSPDFLASWKLPTYLLYRISNLTDFFVRPLFNDLLFTFQRKRKKRFESPHKSPLGSNLAHIEISTFFFWCRFFFRLMVFQTWRSWCKLNKCNRQTINDDPWLLALAPEEITNERIWGLYSDQGVQEHGCGEGGGRLIAHKGR